jgi:hypothetical protein
MAIYRPTRRRWPLALAAGCLGLGAGVGVGALVARGSPDPVAAVRALRADLAGAAALLEVVEVEYRESVARGRVVAEAEYRGARDALERSRTRYLAARPALRVLDPAAADAIDRAYDALAALVDRRGDPGEVQAAARSLRALLARPLSPGSTG